MATYDVKGLMSFICALLTASLTLLLTRVFSSDEPLRDCNRCKCPRRPLSESHQPKGSPSAASK